MIARIRNKIARRLFPTLIEHEERQRTERLRRDNARMQAALEQWNRCDDAAAYLDRHHRSL